jgi:uncharacterized membrane protein
MTTTRLEAFSDGVLAIIITIMVLEIKVPHNSSWEALWALAPVFNSYVLSFIFVGIYWGNHHHLLHTVKHVSWKIIWANLHLLFWLSLIPFATGWMGENHFAQNAVIIYGMILIFSAIAFTILQLIIQKEHPKNSQLEIAFQKLKTKGIISMTGYISGVGFAFLNTTISLLLFFIFGSCHTLAHSRPQYRKGHRPRII